MPLESLEPRRLLSFTLIAGTLTVTGTGGNDSITLKSSGSNIKLSDNGTTHNFSKASVTAIVIHGGDGNDLATIDDSVKPPATLLGEAGNDTLRGGGGNDLIDGGTGADDMSGGGGKDTVDYSSRVNPVYVGLGTLADDGEAGEHDNVHNDIETILGGAGNDTLIGAGPANLLEGNAGDDSLSGSGGNDTLDGGIGADTMLGGPGIDTVTYASRTADLNITIDDQSNDGEAHENDNIGSGVENVIGGHGNDSIVGSGGDNLLMGGDGNDTIFGQAGNDTIDGGLGTDSMSGGDGLDTVTYASRTAGVTIQPEAPFGAPNSGEPGENDSIYNDFETLVGGSGDDLIGGFQFQTPDNVAYLEIGNAGNDTITGGFGDDTIQGGAGDDSIDGLGGDNNLMDGGDGNDVLTSGTIIPGGGTMLGGAGNDTLGGGLSNTVRVMRGGPGDDVLGPKASATLVTGDAGNDVAFFDYGGGSGLDTNLAGTGIDTIVGTVFNDHIVGSDANEVILGLAGNDTLEGMGGDDYLDGGIDLDSLSGGDGNDVFVNDDGQNPDTIDGGNGFDIAQFGGFLDAVHSILIDTYANIEFLYDPSNAGQVLPSLAISPNLARAAAISAAATGPSVANGVLNISGTSSADSISVILDSTGKNVNVTLNGASSTFPLSGLKGIFIDCGGGNDAVALIRSDGLRGITIPATVAGGNGNDTITGGNANDSLAGGLGDDSLRGGNGDDNLNGGNDATINGSDGADFISGGPGNDSVFYSQRQDGLNIDLSDGKKSNDGAPGEGDNVQTDVENAFGGNGDDSIVGNASANLISGGGGNDTIHAGDGSDKLIGSRGNDVVNGEGGINVYSLADGARDDFDGGRQNFISGDVGTDFNTITGQFLG